MRRVEQAQRDAYNVRPAIYTQEVRRFPVSLGNLVAPAIVVAAALACALLLFGPVRTFYAAWRESGTLQARYEALQVQNDELTEQLERLQSLEGIEDEARRRGYAYPDEEVLVVDGLPDQTVADPAEVDAAVAKYEESLPWYVGVLDTLFGYDGGTHDQ